jgi:hypothetical protein
MRTHGLVLTLLAAALASCGLNATAARLIFDLEPGLAISRVRVEARLGAARLTVDDVTGAVQNGRDLVILFPDSLGGQQVEVYVAGLGDGGAQVASGHGTVVLQGGATAEAHVAMVAVDCPSGQHDCDGGCFDDAEVGHCGLACVACPVPPSHGTGGCEQSQCTLACDQDYVLCGDLCVDVWGDPEHCGDCGHACDPGQVCVDWACQAG